MSDSILGAAPARAADTWSVGDIALTSRFLLGTAGYPSPQVLREAIAASGTQVVTVGLKRQLAAGGDNGFVEIIRAALKEQGARQLAKDGFTVFPYCTDDLVTCKRLLDAGCPLLMPWGAPIGSGQGLVNPFALRLLRERLPGVVLIVDAGIGAPSHAAQALEMGYDAVLLNSAVSQSPDPVRMAGAFRQAIEAGRAAHLAGVMARQDFAVATTPVTGNPFLLG